MDEAALLTKTLKTCLKRKGLTYRDLAKKLSLSEASVKRLFSHSDFTLKRLQVICTELGMTIQELARLTQETELPTRNVLTVEQEAVLAADERLFSYFYLLVTGHSQADIASRFKIGAAEQRTFLAALEGVDLLDRLPGDRIKMKVYAHVRWRPQGALMKLYATPLKQEFIDHPFEDDHSEMSFVPGHLTKAAHKLMLRKMAKLIQSFRETSDFCEDVEADHSRSVCLMVAIRPWTFSVIGKLKSS